MATAHVQSKGAQTASGTTVGVTLTSTVGAGNHICASTAASAATTPTCNLATSNSTPATSTNNGAGQKTATTGAVVIALRMDYFENTTSASWTVTGHTSATAEITIVASESSGVATTGSLGVNNFGTSNSASTLATGSITPTAGSILYAATTDSGGTTTADTINLSFTVGEAGGAGSPWDGANERAGDAFLAAAAASATNPTWTLPGAAAVVAMITEFLAAAAGGLPPGRFIEPLQNTSGLMAGRPSVRQALPW